MYITVSEIYGSEVYNLTSSDIATATVEQFIVDAESIINGKCSKRYNVPFTSTGIPDLIKKIDRDLTGYFCLELLHQQKNRNKNDWVAGRYDNAMKLLDDIYKDKLELIASLTSGGVGVIQPDSEISLQATYEDTPLAVNVDNELSWRVPDTILDGIYSNRLGNDN